MEKRDSRSRQAHQNAALPSGVLVSSATPWLTIGGRAPCDALAGHVEWIWHVSWDVPPGDVFEQSTLPHPQQHLVVDPAEGSGLFGIMTKRFDRVLSGKGAALGVKFMPGRLSCFLPVPLQDLTDRRFGFDQFGDIDVPALEDRLVRGDWQSVAADLEALLAGRLTQDDADSRLACEIVALAAADRSLLRASALADAAGLSLRSLERLFARHVGIGPKWVIDRCRMLEAVDRLNSGERLDLADLALDLGFFDQAHFSVAFQRITSVSPRFYASKGIPEDVCAK